MNRNMYEVTRSLTKTLPGLYSQEHVKDPMVRAHFFNSWGPGDWWITEGSSAPGFDFTMFGLCDLGVGFPELGYVSLAELASVSTVEHDEHWTPVPLSEVRK
jgi:hypothetical protein